MTPCNLVHKYVSLEETCYLAPCPENIDKSFFRKVYTSLTKVYDVISQKIMKRSSGILSSASCRRDPGSIPGQYTAGFLWTKCHWRMIVCEYFVPSLSHSRHCHTHETLTLTTLFLNIHAQFIHHLQYTILVIVNVVKWNTPPTSSSNPGGYGRNKVRSVTDMDCSCLGTFQLQFRSSVWFHKA
jgi:hypothetical protein